MPNAEKEKYIKNTQMREGRLHVPVVSMPLVDCWASDRDIDVPIVFVKVVHATRNADANADADAMLNEVGGIQGGEGRWMPLINVWAEELAAIHPCTSGQHQ